jgi:hypothetical protein
VVVLQEKEVIMSHNAKAIKLIEGRFSDLVKTFNHYPVSETDSDAQFWLVKERADLARVALERAPEIKVTTLARSLGDIYRTIRQHLTPDERIRWEKIATGLESLSDKYGI